MSSKDSSSFDLSVFSCSNPFIIALQFICSLEDLMSFVVVDILLSCNLRSPDRYSDNFSSKIVSID